MAKLLLHLLLLLPAAAVLITATPALAAGAGNSTTPTAYEMLDRYNLPRGILPEGVQSYVLNPDGSFEVFFSGNGGGGDCQFRINEGYTLWYSHRIAGSVAAGSIRALQGVKVKVLFVWIGINQVDRAGDRLRFTVGPLSASFPVSSFTRSPRCGCGFDCANNNVDAAAAAVAAS